MDRFCGGHDDAHHQAARGKLKAHRELRPTRAARDRVNPLDAMLRPCEACANGPATSARESDRGERCSGESERLVFHQRYPFSDRRRSSTDGSVQIESSMKTGKPEPPIRECQMGDKYEWPAVWDPARSWQWATI
ncbi:hypothetical protein ZHAS_00011734 [Anopheles sinensis]|uniref:Uncharacterized protein n=1 Tax=Anopheles sinensis TaxID=74873 RepID=A0A084W116_ANOSI|nr:hypothetical protein ZHAS_00011734 [Anopheles sinensis]